MDVTGKIRIEDVEIPPLIHGTSPFIGAGQFGKNAIAYREKFLHDSKLIAKFFTKFAEKGCACVNALPERNIIDAIKISYDNIGFDYPLITTVFDEGLDEQLEMCKEVNTAIVTMHAFVSDRLDE